MKNPLNPNPTSDEVVDPTPPRGLDRRSILIIVMALACLMTGIMLAANRPSRQNTTPTTEVTATNPTYGGVFEVPTASIVSEVENSDVPPGWADPMTPPLSLGGDDRRTKEYENAMRGGGGLLFKGRSVDGSGDGEAVARDAENASVRRPGDPRTLMEGTTMEAVLEGGINSDRPGPVSARIIENVLDTQTLSHTLIPAGTRVIGTMAASGEAIALSWHRLIFPDGSSMDLNNLPAVDAGGAGVAGNVDRHRAGRFGSALMMALVGATTTYAGSQVSEHGGLIGGSLALQLGQQGTRTLQQVRRPPTVKVPAGHRFRIWVTEDIRFEPLK